MRTARVSVVVALAVLALVSWNCKGSGTESPNVAPVTRLANIPPDSITSDNPRMTLYWVGDDPDGFVTGYRYRWSFQLSTTGPILEKPWVYMLNIGVDKSGGQKFALMTSATEATLPAVYKYFATLPPEGLDTVSASKLDAGDSILVEGAWVWASNPSGVRFPVHENPNSGTFIFDSQDSLNPHIFTVQAIDDHGALDNEIRFASGKKAGNSVYFVTPQVPAPTVEVITFPLDTVLTLDKTTDTYRGSEFDFRGIDPNSRTIEYSWVVDRETWQADSGYIPWSDFTESPVARVIASDFPASKKFDINHTLYVRARNEFGTISADSFLTQDRGWIQSHVAFYTVYPRFASPFNEHKILLLNSSFGYPDTSLSVSYPSADSLDAYYTGIMGDIGKGGFDVKRVHYRPNYFPGLSTLAHYSSIFIYADVTDTASHTPGFSSWSDPGDGENKITDYVNAGGKIILTVYNPRSWLSTAFLQYVPHMDDNRVRGLDTCFLGAKADAGYPDLMLDSTRVDPNGHGRLAYVWVGRNVGFGEIIYRFHETAPGAPTFQDPDGSFEGDPCGIRYDGLTYKVIYFGFPLYYCYKPAVEQALQKAFQDIGE